LDDEVTTQEQGRGSLLFLVDGISAPIAATASADDRQNLVPPQRFLLTPAPEELVARAFSPVTAASLHLPPICDSLTSEGSRASSAPPPWRKTRSASSGVRASR
jgi:hypothetical protein